MVKDDVIPLGEEPLVIVLERLVGDLLVVHHGDGTRQRFLRRRPALAPLARGRTQQG